MQERTLKSIETFVRCLISAQPKRLIHHRHDRMKRRVLETGFGGALDPAMRGARQAFMELVDDGRFTDSGFARNQHT